MCGAYVYVCWCMFLHVCMLVEARTWNLISPSITLHRIVCVHVHGYENTHVHLIFLRQRFSWNLKLTNGLDWPEAPGSLCLYPQDGDCRQPKVRSADCIAALHWVSYVSPHHRVTFDGWQRSFENIQRSISQRRRSKKSIFVNLQVCCV